MKPMCPRSDTPMGRRPGEFSSLREDRRPLASWREKIKEGVGCTALMDLVFGLFSDSSWTAFGRLSECSLSCAWVAQNPLEVPLGTPWRCQNPPLEVPKSSQECPKRVPRALKSGQQCPRATKSVPRASEERSKSGQESKVSAQDVSKRPPERLLEGS